MLKSSLLILLIAVGFVAAKAEPACDVQINVYPIQALNAKAPTPLNGAKIALKQTAGGAALIPSGAGNQLYKNLVEGNYQIIVSLNNYKTTTKRFDVKCDSVTASLPKPETIFLWEGDPKDIAPMYTDTLILENLSAGATLPSGQRIKIKSIRLRKPDYPVAAGAAGAGGIAKVRVTLDEFGNVVSASMIAGHPKLKNATEEAALDSKFAPTLINNIPIKVEGYIIYAFGVPRSPAL